MDRVGKKLRLFGRHLESVPKLVKNQIVVTAFGTGISERSDREV